MLVTIAEVLDLPPVRIGRPAVRAGRDRTDDAVRWVHVSEQRSPAGTLRGGELVLSIGATLADPAHDHARYLAELRDAGAVGLVVELGQHLQALPTPLVQAARALDFPLVELRNAVRFVEITEEVHARILHRQYARLEFTHRVTETFRTLMVEGAEPGTVVTEAAALLGLPVVLEDLGHRALAHAGGVAQDLLRDWAARSRQAPAVANPGRTGPEGWLAAPVGARGERWGRVVVPRRDTGVADAPTVLAQAAEAITVLDRLSRAAGGDALGDAHGELLADLLRATPTMEAGLRARARALGLPVHGPYAALVLATAEDEVPVVAAAARSLRRPALVGRLRPDRLAAVVACRSVSDEQTAVDALVGRLPAGRTRVVAAAEPAETFGGLADTLHDALQTADVAAAAPDPSVHPVWRSRHLGARKLLWRLRDDSHLLSYVDEQLGPALRAAEPRRSQLLATLRAYLESGGVVTAFAARIGVSRPAAYGRARKLAETLDRDLDDPLTRMSLHLAVLALDQTGTRR